MPRTSSPLPVLMYRIVVHEFRQAAFPCCGLANTGRCPHCGRSYSDRARIKWWNYKPWGQFFIRRAARRRLTPDGLFLWAEVDADPALRARYR